MIFRQGEVIANDDSSFDGSKLSRVQIKILPEMKGITDQSIFPWVEPFVNSNGVSADSTEHNIPEVGSMVTVLILDVYWKILRYTKGLYIEGFAAYQKWENDISSQITDIDSQTYPQPNLFQYFADGSAYFRNTSSGEMGWIHNNGCYVVFDKDGNIINYSKDKSFKIYNDKTVFEIKDDGTVDINVNNNAKLTLDASATAKFTLTDGVSTIESSVAGLDLNGHVTIIP